MVTVPPGLQERLTEEDDPVLWEQVLNGLAEDASMIESVKRGAPLYSEAGVCSHWLRPHQLRWAAAFRLRGWDSRVWTGALNYCSISLWGNGLFRRSCQQNVSAPSALPSLPERPEIDKQRSTLFGRHGPWMRGVSGPRSMGSATRMAFGN